VNQDHALGAMITMAGAANVGWIIFFALFLFFNSDSFFGTASSEKMMLLLDISRHMFSTHFSYFSLTPATDD